LLSFSEIENINKTDLPVSARKYRPYWANHINNSIAKSWMLAGYKVSSVNFLDETILFVKTNGSNIKKQRVLLNTKDIKEEANEIVVCKKSDEIIKEIENLIVETSTIIGTPLDEDDFYILYQPKNHIPKKLPKKKIAVYSFVYNGIFLKIGQAGIKSNARYQSQHYYPSSSNSNLAKSILNDPMFKNFLNEDMISGWIKENCERYDIIINSYLGKNTLNYIEGMLHMKYNPKYEG
jgi:hypothetical protein